MVRERVVKIYYCRSEAIHKIIKNKVTRVWTSEAGGEAGYGTFLSGLVILVAVSFAKNHMKM